MLTTNSLHIWPLMQLNIMSECQHTHDGNGNMLVYADDVYHIPYFNVRVLVLHFLTGPECA